MFMSNDTSRGQEDRLLCEMKGRKNDRPSGQTEKVEVPNTHC